MEFDEMNSLIDVQTLHDWRDGDMTVFAEADCSDSCCSSCNNCEPQEAT